LKLCSLKEIDKIYRVSSWYPYLGFTLFGFLLRSNPNLELLKYIILDIFLLSYAFSLNDYYDLCIKKKYFFPPLILSLIFLLFLNPLQISLSYLFLLIVTLYSANPIRLKSKPFLSSFCNGFGFLILFFIGYQRWDLGLLFGMLLFFLEMVAQFIHETVHLKEDKRHKIITTAVFFGRYTIKILCYTFLLITFMICLYLFHIGMVNVLFLFITAFFIFYFIADIYFHKINKKLRKRYRVFGIITGMFYIFLLFYS